RQFAAALDLARLGGDKRRQPARPVEPKNSLRAYHPVAPSRFGNDIRRKLVDRAEVRMRRSAFPLWIAVTLIALVDFLVCFRLRLVFFGWTRLVPAGAVLAATALFYQLSGRSTRLARMAHWALLWIAFANAGAILTYVAAAAGGPPHDAVLSAFDHALGFDWTRWHYYLVDHRALRLGLDLAYGSLLPQILVSILYFALAGRDDRNYELLLNAIVALLLTAAVFILFPALGHGAAAGDPYIRDLDALRSGGALRFDMERLQGLVSFPSFHMVLALLILWAHRDLRLLAPFALVNLVMLVSITGPGEHYLADIFGGAAVAGLTILATRTALRPRRRIFAGASPL
ncbi:MAG TPA: phosphatase PAP2 family protein, partial [Stellaceae bacterium]|nr:phosphatase PAP2 family protein [Stellaceae bacterium]